MRSPLCSGGTGSERRCPKRRWLKKPICIQPTLECWSVSLRNPSLNVIKELAKALGVPLAKLIAEAEAIQQRANPKK